MHRFLPCLRGGISLGALVGFMAMAGLRADEPATAGENPLKGDYAGTSRFQSTEQPNAKISKSLLVICITGEGKFSASYVVKTTDINFYVRGTVDKEGVFKGTVFYLGKEWGVHSGRFNKLPNGDLEGFIEELPGGRDKPWGRGYIRAHPVPE